MSDDVNPQTSGDDLPFEAVVVVDGRVVDSIDPVDPDAYLAGEYDFAWRIQQATGRIYDVPKRPGATLHVRPMDACPGCYGGCSSFESNPFHPPKEPTDV